MHEIMEGVFVDDFKQTSHISMTTAHITNYSGKFVCEGKPLNGKMFIKQSVTAVLSQYKFGKTAASFCLLSEPAKKFKTIKGLIEAYNGNLKAN